MEQGTALQLLESHVAQLEDRWPSDRFEKRSAAAEIGPLVRALRDQLGWTVHQLASRSDVDMGGVVRLEAGKELGSLRWLRMITSALASGISDGDLTRAST